MTFHDIVITQFLIKAGNSLVKSLFIIGTFFDAVIVVMDYYLSVSDKRQSKAVVYNDQENTVSDLP